MSGGIVPPGDYVQGESVLDLLHVRAHKVVRLPRGFENSPRQIVQQ